MKKTIVALKAQLASLTPSGVPNDPCPDKTPSSPLLSSSRSSVDSPLIYPPLNDAHTHEEEEERAQEMGKGLEGERREEEDEEREREKKGREEEKEREGLQVSGVDCPVSPKWKRIDRGREGNLRGVIGSRRDAVQH